MRTVSLASLRTLLSTAAAAGALTLAVSCASPESPPDDSRDQAEPATLITLAEAEAQVSAQLAEDEQLTLAQPLYEQNSARMSLRQFERGATVPDHAVPGTAMAYVMEGELEITVDDEVHTVSAGQILVMEPDTTHSVHAVEPSQMLLTIAESP